MKYDSAQSEIIAYPFNFYTFPQNGSNSLFLSDSSSLQFLRENGFDFNKFIDKGIDFLSIDGEKWQREKHEMRENKKQERINERKQNKQIVKPKTERDTQFLQDVEMKLQQFINNTTTKQEEILKLGLLGGFRRFLIYQLIEQNIVTNWWHLN